MSVGKKRKRRKVGPPPTDEDFAAEARGEAIRFAQRDILAHMIETAVRLWFEDNDPLSIHLLGEAAYRCLDDLSDKIGILRSEVGHDQFTLVYDYLRHASPNRDDELLWVRGANRWLLFEVAGSYEKFFGRITPTMRSFQLYFMLHCLKRPGAREELLEFLPDGTHVEDFLSLTRSKFLDKTLPLFAGIGRPASSLWAFRKAHLPSPPPELDLP